MVQRIVLRLPKEDFDGSEGEAKAPVAFLDDNGRLEVASQRRELPWGGVVAGTQAGGPRWQDGLWDVVFCKNTNLYSGFAILFKEQPFSE